MLACLVIGESKCFTIEIDKIKTISQLRDIIKNDKKKNAFAKIDANELTLFKVNIPENRKHEIHSGIDVERDFGGEELFNDLDSIEEHFGVKPTEKHIHIIIKPPVNLGSYQQGHVKSVPPEPDAVFENFLNSEHGQFLRSYVTNNDALPLYKSKIPLKTDVPATSSNERPSLLLYNLPGGSIQKHKPITRISDIQSAIAKAKNNLLVMLGTSGCGKTRTCYELLCENWGLYFVASRKGNGGSGDIEAIENYLGEKITDDLKMNRKHAEHITRCAILSRLLILNHCINLSFNPSTFNAQRWLLLQICQKIFGKLYNYTDDIFLTLMLLLADCTSSSVKNYIDTTYKKILKLKKINVFPIILDETQALEMVLKGKFKSRRNEEKRSLLSPIIQSLREPAPSIVNHYVIPCGTGLGILSLEEVLITGIAKPETGIDKFTEFGGWQNIAHVKNYISNIMELTEDEYNCLYDHFRGRFRPIVTCVEEIIMGNPVEDAVSECWKILTMKSNINHQSLYNQLLRIIDMERPNHVLSTNILDLYKSVTLVYYYSGSPFLFTDINQMIIVESGFGRLQVVNPPTISHLKQVFGGMDEDMLRISSVDADLLYTASQGGKYLVAFVDEPFALTASFNFFKDYDSLPKDILNMMSKVKNASSCGTLWQMYLPEEFMQIFNGQNDIRKIPIFAKLTENEDLPPFCIGSPRIVKSSRDNVPLVANATTGYTLNKFFNEPSELRPAFYFPDDHCGPDIIFFVEFEDNIIVPVFVQVKLRYSVHTIAGALSTIDPKMFYKDKNGKIFQEESTRPIINKIINRCNEFGSIGILVAYPADIRQESFITNNHLHNLRNRLSQQQLIGIIDHENASEVFQEDHLRFLDTLKNTIKRKK
ncbi:23343_t:CDS:2 [Gigaspora margarita]|uniref:23343_t:CDS:1 n=1 Tax=Gigaspora margarita TaxID=4874 RepID=A0ABN7VAJ2_GIGMA|nr:23343_t:CDS:2 [Gigaspora margarita]